MSQAAPTRRAGRAGTFLHIFPPQGTFSPHTLYAALGRSECLAEAFARIAQRTDPVLSARTGVRMARFLANAEPPSVEELQQADALEVVSALASLAAHEALSRRVGKPTALLGVSAGDFAAMTAAGVFGLEDATGMLLEAAAVQRRCPGRMMSLVCSPGQAETIIAMSGAHGAKVALVYNDRSVVITAPTDDLELLRKTAETSGVHAALLPVPFGSHHAGLNRQADELSDVVGAYRRRKATLPVYSAAGARVYEDGESIPRAMAQNLTLPVDFPRTLRRCLRTGANVVLDLDTGGSLAASARIVSASFAGVAVHDPFTDERFAW
ncbi:acyltransferase domain-containing protein [Streptomyces longwoodensis]|uniref:acyltransferase domain-containing protein n=1 Tax=Streptomyces longwoodensis TaxID=68231 RepID=UPI0037B2ADCD